LAGDEGIQQYEQSAGKRAPWSTGMLLKIWLLVIVAWSGIKLVDYMLGIPIEWYVFPGLVIHKDLFTRHHRIIVALGHLVMTFKFGEITIKIAVFSAVVDLILYLILPTWFVVRSANILILIAVLVIFNLMVLYTKFSQ